MSEERRPDKRRNTAKYRADVMARRQRRSTVEKLLLSGHTNLAEIAARVGVSKSTVHKDIKWIEGNWEQRHDRNSDNRRTVRVKQLEAILQKAALSFEESRQERITTTTTQSEDGYSESQKVEQSHGDPAYLRVMKECIAEMAKIEGLRIMRTEVTGAGGGPIQIEQYQELMQDMGPDELQSFIDATRHISAVVEGRVVGPPANGLLGAPAAASGGAGGDRQDVPAGVRK